MKRLTSRKINLNKKIFLSLILVAFTILLTGCFDTSELGSSEESTNTSVASTTIANTTESEITADSIDELTTKADTAEFESIADSTDQSKTEKPKTKKTAVVAKAPNIQLSDIPSYSGDAYVNINGGKPFFKSNEYSTVSFETYSELDDLGRCGVAFACVGKDIMPTEKRGSIGMVKPSGWHTTRYDDLIHDKYLYNRCHLIAYELTSENANVKNLITGTRYMNVEGMLPFENKVVNYIESSGNHVMYRSTPIFKGNDLVAKGVLLEGYSVEDNGLGIDFCVYCYNVQPGITIDYATGDSHANIKTSSKSNDQNSEKQKSDEKKADNKGNNDSDDYGKSNSSVTYILNTNTGKFHYPSCSSVNKMKDHNKQEYTGSRDEIISMGYVPCKRCNP